MKMKKEDLVIRGLGLIHNKADYSSSGHVGNKVLPISDSASSSNSSSSFINTSNDGDQQQRGPSDQKIKDKVNSKGENNKNKTLSRMKELLRWAAAAKPEKGGKFGRKGLHFRNRSATMKSTGFDEEMSNDSPKISLRWEVESCSTTCSAVSAPPSLKYDPHFNSHNKSGNWITTDDEFVVLEL